MNLIMSKKTKVSFFTICLFLLSCSGKGFKHADRYEGLKGDNLRVYVRLQEKLIPENFPNRTGLDTIILSAAKERGILLLTSYSKTRINDPAVLRELNFYIIKNFPEGSVIFRHYTTKKVEAFIDYNIKEIILKIDPDGGKI